MEAPKSSVGDWSALRERVKKYPPLGKHFISPWNCRNREECLDALFPSGNTMPKICSKDCFEPEEEGA